MGVVYYLMERLRQLMGSCWDYCVIWKLSEDPWLLECVDCCCGGSYQKSEEEEAPLIPCKDAMFQHPRMRCCELLSQLPPSLPLDGINAEVLMSNQPRWLNNAKISDLATTAEEMIESKVLIPVPGGLVEFYASKMVPEDQSLIDYVVGQCSALSEQGANSSNMRQLQSAEYSPSTALANLNLSCADATADRIRICNSAMSFLQQFSYLAETPRGGKSEEEEVLVQQQQQAEGEAEEGPAKPESGSDSEEEDESKYSSRRKSGKGTSKNLMAERKRRKKLNERLYTLRSLVPKISKLDRAAILGDAIDYVMELQQQEKELQNELQQDSEDEGVGSSLVSQHHTPGPMDYSNLMPADNYYDDTAQQMEVQVEVAHLDGNEFFIKVFGEHKGVGFVRLMEALHSLGLEITTVNMTSCISLVSYVFTVENKDNEMVQAEYLRDSLLEMTRNQTSEWAEMAKAQGGGTSHHHPDQYQQQHYFHQFQ